MTFGGTCGTNSSPKHLRSAYHFDRLKILLPYFSQVPIGRIPQGTRNASSAPHAHATEQVSDTTVNRDLEALRHMLYWAVDEGLLAGESVVSDAARSRAAKARIVMTVAEEDRLLNAGLAPSPPDHHRRALHRYAARGDPDPAMGACRSHPWTAFRNPFQNGRGEEGLRFHSRKSFFPSLPENRKPRVVFLFKDPTDPRNQNCLEGRYSPSGHPLLPVHDLTTRASTAAYGIPAVMQEVRKALMGHSSGEARTVSTPTSSFPLSAKRSGSSTAWSNSNSKRHKETLMTAQKTGDPATPRSPANGSKRNGNRGRKEARV